MFCMNARSGYSLGSRSSVWPMSLLITFRNAIKLAGQTEILRSRSLACILRLNGFKSVSCFSFSSSCGSTRLFACLSSMFNTGEPVTLNQRVSVMQFAMENDIYLPFIFNFCCSNLKINEVSLTV